MQKTKKPLSLYVHIPFCVQKCLYCDFLSGVASEQEKEEYIQWLSREIVSWGRKWKEEYRLETVFLGGGTPSCLSPRQLEHLGKVIRANFSFNGQLEYTTEANPGTVTNEHIKAWKEMGINRVSLGLQSAQNEELRCLGRIHTYEDFLHTYEKIVSAGLENINIDIMADIPGQTMASYIDTVKKVVSLKPKHISSYSLIVEPGTAFFDMEQQGLLEREEEDVDREMYEFTRTFLAESGYHRYEISNYALTGKECHHNCVYWQGGEYIGVGLGASSYFQQCRFSNPRQMVAYQEYVRGMEQKEGKAAGTEKHWKAWQFQEFEVLNRRMQMEEFMFLGLRMQRGVSRIQFLERFGVDMEEVYGKVLPKLFQNKLLAETDFHDRIYLTNRGIDLSNMVLAEFLLE